MVDKTPAPPGRPAGGRLPDVALETSRLLVQFLHAAYATRHLDVEPAPGNGESRNESFADVSSHAVRAAVHIYQHGERTVGQLASGVGISYGWASRVVEELEAGGYAIRERDADDRRIVRVRLNPQKLEQVRHAYQWRVGIIEEALEPMSDSEREIVQGFLRRVTELLRESGARPA